MSPRGRVREPALALVCLAFISCGLLCLGCGGGGSSSKAPPLKEQYEQALQISDPATRAQRMVDIARDYVRQDNAIGADPAMEAAEQAAGSAEQQRQRAELYLELFDVKAMAGDAKYGVELLKKATRAAREVENPVEQFPLQIQLAKAYAQDLHKANSAKGALRKAEPLIESLPPEQKLGARIQYAVAATLAEENEQGETMLSEAASAVDALEGRERCEGLGDLAVALMELGKTSEAETHLAGAAASAESLEDPEAKAHAFISLGRKLLLAGKEGSAGKYFQSASSAAESVGDPHLRNSIMDEVNALKRMLN